MHSKNYKGDIVGGIVSALVSLPLALASGLLLFKGFNGLEQFGINAAFYTAILASIISLFIGSHSLQIGGPLVVTALILSDFLQSISSKIEAISSNLNITIFTIMFTCVIITGVIQLIFAYLKLGKLIKFLPLSVTMGISTTIGIIIIVKQLPIVFNTQSDNLSETFLLVFITIFILILLFLKDFVKNKEKIKSVLRFDPFIFLPIIVPIIAGLIFFTFNENSNLLLNNVKVELPNIVKNYDSFIDTIHIIKDLLPQIILTSFAIALMSSLSSLLSVSLLEKHIQSNSSNTSLELSGQGIGNILSGLFGGMPSAGTEARSLVNYHAGGRTKLSVIVNILTIFAIIFLFNDYISYIPIIILSAMLVYTGIVMSLPTIRMIKKLFCICKNENMRSSCIKDIIYSFAIIAVMLTTAFLTDITIAIVFGFAVASLFFIYEMMINSNFTILNGNSIRSKRERAVKAREYLQKNGDLISIIELDGSIFFGTADALRKAISSINSNSKWIILDFKKVTEVDITGAEIIKLSVNENKDIQFILSHIRQGDDTFQALCSVDLIGENGLKWFEYTDFALEYAENLLLKKFDIPSYLNSKTFELDEISVTRNLDKNEIDILSNYLVLKDFKKGEYLYKEDEIANEIYFLRSGSVTVWDEHEKEFYVNKPISRTRRVTFSAGIVVGQMAFFENTKHSVEAIADVDISTYLLTREKFNELLKKHPLVAQDLLLKFCEHLSKRLKEVTYEVQILERW